MSVENHPLIPSSLCVCEGITVLLLKKKKKKKDFKDNIFLVE